MLRNAERLRVSRVVGVIILIAIVILLTILVLVAIGFALIIILCSIRFIVLRFMPILEVKMRVIRFVKK